VRSLELAVKYLAGERLIGTAAERAAMSTGFDLINTGDAGTAYNASSNGITGVTFANSSKSGFGRVASFPAGDNPSSADPPEMNMQGDFPSAQNWVGSGEYCIGAWGKVIDTNGDQELIDVRTDGSNNYMKMYLWGSGGFNGIVYITPVAGQGGSYTYLRDTTSAGLDGGWHHFMIERSGSVHTFYIDNVSKATWTNSDTFASFDQVRIGRWWEGELDEMFFLARKTTSAEKTSMQSGVISGISSMYSDSDLKLYYNCDNTIAYPNLTNGTIFEESDTGKIYMFDGTDTWNEIT